MASDKKEGIELYHQCCISDQSNIYEVISQFDSVELPFEYFLEGVELIVPRQYSICTAHSLKTKQIDLLMNIVDYETESKRKIQGLCSNWVSKLPLNSEICYWMKPGNIPFPKELSNACIMIATGTGIAPFLSHIRYREKMIQQNKHLCIIQQNYLFFGCRHEKADFYFSNYLNSQQNNSNIELIPAFSRDQTEKQYVTNKLKENSDILAKYISENIDHIKIIIVGTAKFMPQAIEMEFLEILKIFCNNDIEEAMNLKEKLVKEKQYIVEAWS